MSESNLDAIQRELKLRKVRKAGQDLLSGRELYDFISIKERHDSERDATEMLYRNEFKMRVNVAYKMLLKKAGSVTREHTPPFVPEDRLNTQKLMRKAQELVRFEHDRTMARLDESELKESGSFLEKCSQRARYVEAFKTAARAKRSHTPTQSPTTD